MSPTSDESSGRRFPEWDQRYKEQSVESMPWFYPHLDPDLAQALDRPGLSRGRALDIGTGPGTQAIALARRGWEVTATDLSETAVASAARRAEAEQVKVRFVRDDVLRTTVTGPFDLVFDRGCFHVIDPKRREDYARAVAELVRPDGYLFIKCFSARQPGTVGPYRFVPSDIESLFSGRFTVHSITETVYQGTLDPPPFALFCVLQRKP